MNRLPTISYATWNTIYSYIPDFEKYNSKLPLKVVFPAALATAIASNAITETFYSRAITYCSFGLFLFKGGLIIGEIFQKAIYPQTGYALEENCWGFEITPPTDFSYTTEKPVLVRSLAELVKKAKSAESFEEILLDCDAILAKGFLYAKAVKEELQKNSEAKKIFTSGNESSWIGEGAVILPYVYRIIYNLELPKVKANQSWKNLFFTDHALGRYRNSFNELMQQTIEEVGGQEAIDQDYTLWFQQHESLKQRFPETPVASTGPDKRGLPSLVYGPRLHSIIVTDLKRLLS